MKLATRHNLEIALSLLAVAGVGAAFVWAYSQPAAAGGSAPKPTTPGGGPVTNTGGSGPPTVVPGGSPSPGSVPATPGAGGAMTCPPGYSLFNGTTCQPTPTGTLPPGPAPGSSGSSPSPTPTPVPVPTQPWEGVLVPGNTMRPVVAAGTTMIFGGPAGSTITSYSDGITSHAVNSPNFTYGPVSGASGSQSSITVWWKAASGNSQISIVTISIL